MGLLYGYNCPLIFAAYNRKTLHKTYAIAKLIQYPLAFILPAKNTRKLTQPMQQRTYEMTNGDFEPNAPQSELAKNVSDKNTWLRLLYLLMFGLAFYISVLLVLVVSIFQFLAKLFTGQSFASLAEMGNNLATYQAQVTRFVTFASDEKPFPFAPAPTSTPQNPLNVSPDLSEKD